MRKSLFGCSIGKAMVPKPKDAVEDCYATYEDLQRGLRMCGLESSNVVVAIDYTKSNTWTGETSFGGKCLHDIDAEHGALNPYQTGQPCEGFAGVLARYNQVTPTVKLSGPTNFAAVIHETIRIVKMTRRYHILVIIADGQVTDEKGTDRAIVEASNYPISIIMVGVGDGPWGTMCDFDDPMRRRRFNNFHFVEFSNSRSASNPDIAFATAALKQIPDQYVHIRKEGLLTVYPDTPAH
ncbi:hypothetical protein SDRG_09554 [Saprolegnia diclina VS20]|uniref:Copine C-terminal domain-containing protein n=1 Tax=Saprolegnia diclina (strain VS20) TaxID=1156394 RepID=T0Q5C7_SAPDV|nr:hypothetical protein SDRG_09554 [Saprolegnia diclina VS20]EQC33034.1 hypothetical protein SDRG_09554 [Saprolegnia diclina VS20]|eukprot:XP_008613720.1 hypothetical protein SDRG_09554 [Saprolegnia diclina VS20]